MYKHTVYYMCVHIICTHTIYVNMYKLAIFVLDVYTHTMSPLLSLFTYININTQLFLPYLPFISASSTMPSS